MKKYLFSVAVIIFSLIQFAQAQEEMVITGTKKINKKLTPQQVVDSLNSRFPDAKAVQYYQAPASGVHNGWVVTEDDELPSDASVDYYTISFKNNNMNYYGLYDKKGHLLKSKQEHSISELPEAVSNSLKNIGEMHPGYTVISKTYYKSTNESKSKE
ncbi:MAG: hypothetical protein J7497_16970, partial [Chitinophagaceae bacterium]|nr:hypothetical protein [Chitinophagaceae bacterium]